MEEAVKLVAWLHNDIRRDPAKIPLLFGRIAKLESFPEASPTLLIRTAYLTDGAVLNKSRLKIVFLKDAAERISRLLLAEGDYVCVVNALMSKNTTYVKGLLDLPIEVQISSSASQPHCCNVLENMYVRYNNTTTWINAIKNECLMDVGVCQDRRQRITPAWLAAALSVRVNLIRCDRKYELMRKVQAVRAERAKAKQLTAPVTARNMVPSKSYKDKATNEKATISVAAAPAPTKQSSVRNGAAFAASTKRPSVSIGNDSRRPITKVHFNWQRVDPKLTKTADIRGQTESSSKPVTARTSLPGLNLNFKVPVFSKNNSNLSRKATIEDLRSTIGTSLASYMHRKTNLTTTTTVPTFAVAPVESHALVPNNNDPTMLITKRRPGPKCKTCVDEISKPMTEASTASVLHPRVQTNRTTVVDAPAVVKSPDPVPNNKISKLAIKKQRLDSKSKIIVGKELRPVAKPLTSSAHLPHVQTYATTVKSPGSVSNDKVSQPETVKRRPGPRSKTLVNGISKVMAEASTSSTPQPQLMTYPTQSTFVVSPTILQKQQQAPPQSAAPECDMARIAKVLAMKNDTRISAANARRSQLPAPNFEDPIHELIFQVVFPQFKKDTNVETKKNDATANTLVAREMVPAMVAGMQADANDEYPPQWPKNPELNKPFKASVFMLLSAPDLKVEGDNFEMREFLRAYCPACDSFNKPQNVAWIFQPDATPKPLCHKCQKEDETHCVIWLLHCSILFGDEKGVLQNCVLMYKRAEQIFGCTPFQLLSNASYLQKINKFARYYEFDIKDQTTELRSLKCTFVPIKVENKITYHLVKLRI